MKDGVVCRGCWAIGNACGQCSRCRKEAHGAVMEAHRLRELIKEFADFCEDSGWKNVAEELRRRAGV